MPDPKIQPSHPQRKLTSTSVCYVSPDPCLSLSKPLVCTNMTAPTVYEINTVMSTGLVCESGEHTGHSSPTAGPLSAGQPRGADKVCMFPPGAPAPEPASLSPASSAGQPRAGLASSHVNPWHAGEITGKLIPFKQIKSVLQPPAS